MKITRSTTLPAGVEDVFAVIVTQEHQAAKAAAQSAESSARVEERPDGTVVVHTVRAVPTTGMPGPVVGMVGSTLRVREKQTWGQQRTDGGRRADLEITVDGAPVRMTGILTLSPTGEGSTLAVDADLTCSLPLVGKKIETAAQPTIEELFDLEARQLSERLRRRGPPAR